MNDFYINDNHSIYVIISLVLLTILPFVFSASKFVLFKKFSFKSLVDTLNKAFYIQFAIALIGLVIMYIIQKITYVSQDGVDLLIVEIVLSYSFMMIIYIPFILIINFVKFCAKSLG